MMGNMFRLLPTLLRALDLDEETFQKLLTDSPV